MKLWAIYVWVFREFSFVFLKRFLCLVGLRCSRGLLVLAGMPLEFKFQFWELWRRPRLLKYIPMALRKSIPGNLWLKSTQYKLKRKPYNPEI